jgi:hypothetical protein
LWANVFFVSLKDFNKDKKKNQYLQK